MAEPRPAMLTHPVHLLALGFGSGLAKKAPGTFGTLAAIPVYLLLSPLPLVWYGAVLLGMAVAGVWVCGVTARALGVHDHPAIVWDEIVGFLVVMIAAPEGWLWVALGFGLFRLFDIWKPWPVSVLDRRVHGGLGIMLDDILAGVYGLIVMQALAWAPA